MCLADIGENVERIAHPRSVHCLHVVHVLCYTHHANSSSAAVTSSSFLPTRYTDIACITQVLVFHLSAIGLYIAIIIVFHS